MFRIFGLLVAAPMVVAPVYAQSQRPATETGGQLNNQVGTSTEQLSKSDEIQINQLLPIPKIVPLWTNQKSDTPQTESGNKPTEKWSLSDKIAVVATVAAFLQFVALVITILDGRRSSRRQLRAYVSGQPNFISSFDESHWPIVSIAMQNFGQTPAYELIHRSGIEVFPYPLPSGFVLPQITAAWTLPVVLFPNLPLVGEMQRGSPFSSSKLAALRDRTMRVYIFGEIRYRDVFRRKCWTTFCVSVTAKDDNIWEKITTNSSERFPSGITYETATAGNDADHR